MIRVLLLGPQGSGKGTQAKRIADAYGVPHISTGEILRRAIAEGSALGRRVQPILDRGDLVPDDLIMDLIRERIRDEDGFVLDGFPRTVRQAEALDSMLSEVGKPIDIVLLLQVRDDVASERLLRRAAKEGRNDDTPEVIENRLRLYREETEPVVERYRAEGTVVPIPGDRRVGEVATDIDAALTHLGVRSP